jgi:GNAT superfamily N-acetyltransferase
MSSVVNNTLTIRPATPDDADPIARVHLASWKTTYPGIIPQNYIDSLRVENGIAQWQKRLAESAAIVFVSEDESGIFGFAAGGAIIHPVDGYDAELGALYLLASHQHRCAGRALVRHIAETLHQQGFQTMVVWALEANPACGFYQRLGGVQVAAQTIDIGGATLPELAFGWPDITRLV